jgi:hypothetical protein
LDLPAMQGEGRVQNNIARPIKTKGSLTFLLVVVVVERSAGSAFSAVN